MSGRGRWFGRTVVPCALAGLAALVAGCGPSAPAPRPAPDPYQQRFVDADPCPRASAPKVPAGTGCLTSVTGHLEGGTAVDRVVVFADLDAQRMPDAWWVEAILAHSVAGPEPLPVATSVGGTSRLYARAVGAADANGDGRDEAFVALTGDLYHAAAQPIDAIFALHLGRLVAVTEEGRLFTFRTNGISRFGQGLVCRRSNGRPILTLGRIEQLSPGWVWTEHDLEWNGLTLTPIPGSQDRTGVIPLSVPLNDPRVFHYYELICGRLVIY